MGILPHVYCPSNQLATHFKRHLASFDLTHGWTNTPSWTHFGPYLPWVLSVLSSGPFLFCLYMLPLGSVIARQNLYFHSYADDLQIYFPVKLRGSDAQKSLSDCISNIKQWLALHFFSQIDPVVKTSFFQICLWPKSNPSLICLHLEKVIHAFINFRIDYCDGFYVGVSQSSLSRL